MKNKLVAMLAQKEARMKDLTTKSEASNDVAELRGINGEMKTLTAEIAELRGMIDGMPDEKPTAPVAPAAVGEAHIEPPVNTTQRASGPVGETRVLATYGVETPTPEASARAARHEAAEKRGKDLMEGRSVTITSSSIVVPTYSATDIKPTFNQVSSLVDRVSSKTLAGGESYKQPYVTGYGEGGYTAEGAAATDADTTFGYADINKTKITAYSEDSNEIRKLPAADYDSQVTAGITVASRKKIARQILIGTGATNNIAGIFSPAATAIDATTDLSLATIDTSTLDTIVFGYGGDENVEDAAVLILNKKDLAAFSRLRTTDGKKFHTIVTSGNTGTIDGIPFIINSACKAISDAATVAGDYSMAYGSLSNYQLVIFSDLDVQRSTDYKFKEGMIAHRGEIYVGGNVASKNGFLRIKKASAA